MDVPVVQEKPSFEARMTAVQYCIAQLESLKYLYMVEALGNVDTELIEGSLDDVATNIAHLESELATFFALEVAGFDVRDNTLTITRIDDLKSTQLGTEGATIDDITF